MSRGRAGRRAAASSVAPIEPLSGLPASLHRDAHRTRATSTVPPNPPGFSLFAAAPPGGRREPSAPRLRWAMPLRLIAGPANAGKVELLLDRYLAALEREPVLIVPNRSDVDRVERELVARRPALLGGTIGTFDDVFERIAFDGPDARPVLSPTQRALLVRRVVSAASLNGLAGLGAVRRLRRRARCARSASSSPGCSTPSRLEGDLAPLYARTAPSSTASVSGTATCCAGVRPSGCSPTSTRGTTSRSSPTASRT